MSMELRQLRCFVAVAEERNFRRAAQRLRIAQPALSQQISRFERELHAPLFLRTTRRVELTVVGQALLVEARRVLDAAEHATATVRQAAHGEVGELRIGFVSSAAIQVVPALVAALGRALPDVRLDLREATTERQLAAIGEGRLDVALVRELGPRDDPAARPVRRERLVAALGAGHRLASAESVALAELADEPILVFPRERVPRMFDHLAALCRAAGFTLAPAQEAVEFPTLVGLAAAAVGVAIVPECLSALRLPDVRYVPLADDGATSTISLVTAPALRSEALGANVVAAVDGLRW